MHKANVVVLYDWSDPGKRIKLTVSFSLLVVPNCFRTKTDLTRMAGGERGGAVQGYLAHEKHLLYRGTWLMRNTSCTGVPR